MDTSESSHAPAYVFSCRMCRAQLFTSEDLLAHASSSGFNRRDRFSVNGRRAMEGSEDDSSPCTSYFLDPDRALWAAAESRAAVAEGEAGEGRHPASTVLLPDTIYCPNPRCTAKLGTQSWTGAPCSCGAWVTPAFKVLAKTVDRLPAQL